jgi:phosphoribosylglycinamide formyltransferase-1
MEPQLISEPLKAITGELSGWQSAAGEPLLPAKFIWRGAEYAVGEVLENWKETGACTHGSGERYVRKHWFRIRTANGEEMKIYFERRPRSARETKLRWWLYTFTASGG